jgi:hypothetical protein
MIFRLRLEDLQTLYHYGGTIDCVSCTLSKLGIPYSIIGQPGVTSVQDLRIAQLLNEYKNMINDFLKTSFSTNKVYYWGLNINSNYIDVIENNPNIWESKNGNCLDQDKIVLYGLNNIDNTMRALKCIFQTLCEGYAMGLGMGWLGQNAGHIVVIAKSLDGTPYLIENQNGNKQGVYKGQNGIREYFEDSNLVSVFAIYTTSFPYYKKHFGWIIDKIENERFDYYQSDLPQYLLPDYGYHAESRLSTSVNIKSMSSFGSYEDSMTDRSSDYSQSSLQENNFSSNLNKLTVKQINPSNLIYTTGLRGHHCDKCKQNINCSYRNDQNDYDLCEKCFNESTNDNPYSLKWTIRLKNRFCDFCNKNITKSYHNHNLDLDICVECF